MTDNSTTTVSEKEESVWPGLEECRRNSAEADGKYKSNKFWDAYLRAVFCVFVIGAYPFMISGNVTTALASELVAAECPFHDVTHANCTTRGALPDFVLDNWEKFDGNKTVMLIILNLLLWTPLIGGLVLAIVWKARRRALEGCGVEWISLTTATIVQVVTTLPHSSGTCPFVFDEGETCDSASCNSDWSSVGAWIFGRISFDFCGDMIWSGHTERVLVGLVCIVRTCIDRYGEKWWTQYRIRVCCFCVVYQLTVVLLLLWSHAHYTVDIILAIFIAVTLLTHEKILETSVWFFEEFNFRKAICEVLSRSSGSRVDPATE